MTALLKIQGNTVRGGEAQEVANVLALILADVSKQKVEDVRSSRRARGGSFQLTVTLEATAGDVRYIPRDVFARVEEHGFLSDGISEIQVAAFVDGRIAGMAYGDPRP